MGLAERRAMQQFQSTVFPDLKKKIDDAVGFEIPIEVQWESLAVENKALYYNEDWTKIFFEPLIGALKSLCADDLGKQAVRESVKKILILNSRIYSDCEGFSFKEGVLKLDHDFYNADQVKRRTESLVKMLEKAL